MKNLFALVWGEAKTVPTPLGGVCTPSMTVKGGMLRAHVMLETHSYYQPQVALGMRWTHSSDQPRVAQPDHNFWDISIRTDEKLFDPKTVIWDKRLPMIESKTDGESETWRLKWIR